jgi:surfactin synthase thioesterase subunit
LDYFSQNINLKNIFDINKYKIDLPEDSVQIFNQPFVSRAANQVADFPTNNGEELDDQEVKTIFGNLDTEINENINFNYIIVKSRSSVRAKDVILLFHGLNERLWQKYLPWAMTLNKLTGKAVILFPIAFHMNRAPSAWSNPRIMKKISNYRIEKYDKIRNSTFANAALSTRLHHNPSRFFTSGFQTFSDVTDLVREIREGKHNLIYDDASINFFGYSIGALLAEVLLMSNPNNYFDKSKLFIFCGGPTFDIMFPVAKAILDSEAYNSMSKFFRLFDDYLNRGKIDRSSLPEIKYFKSLLTQYGLRDVREERLMELKSNIYALSLIKDKVVPPESVINTLNGVNKKIPIRTMITDFPYNYSHETPFPADEKKREIVNVNFENIFEIASSFLA